MKSVYQLFALFMLLCGTAYSQHVASVPALRSANSIIRTVGEDVYLLYNLSPSGEARFVFDKSGTVKSFVLPAGMTVGDVEMDSTGNAWFCGKKDSNGVVGWFNVVGVFTGTDVVHYSMLTLPAYLPLIHPCELSRLDLADRSGIVIMAMTGGMRFLNDPQVYSAVLSATYNASLPNPWHYCYRYNKDGDIAYTDISVSGNAIEVSVVGPSVPNGYKRSFGKMISFPLVPLDKDVFLFELEGQQGNSDAVYRPRIMD
jgi:hypothetical protein